MKRLYYYLTLAVILVIYIAIEVESSMGKIDKLSGYLDVVSDSHIETINLSTGRSERSDIASKYLVDDFDVSRGGEKRAISIASNDGLFKILLISNNTEINKIASNDIIRKPVYSPNGKNLVYLSAKKNPRERMQDDWINDWYLYIANFDGSGNKQLYNSGVARFKPSWFPDGITLAVSTKDYKIYALDTITNKAQPISDFGYAPSVSHDGAKIAYLSHDVGEAVRKKIIAYSRLTVGEYKELIASGSQQAKELLKAESYQIKHAIYVYDAATHTSKKMTEEIWVEEPVIWSPNDRYIAYNDRRDVIDAIFVLDVETGAKEQLQGKEGRVMAWR